MNLWSSTYLLFDAMKIDDFVTICEPGKEEFDDFSNFLNGITLHGKICIIHPPKEWRPTFVINDFENLFSKNNSDKKCRAWNTYDYGSMADDFKRNFFEKPVDKVPEGVVETEFWNLMHKDRRLMCSDHIENSLVSNGVGTSIKKSKIITINKVGLSGFPTESCKDLYEQDKMYLNSPWNLSNTKDNCLLKYISSRSFPEGIIESSLQMCFSHNPWTKNEINAWTLHYIHWGDSKTWYCAIFDGAADSVEGSGDEKMRELIGAEGGHLCPHIDDLTALQNVKIVKFFQRAEEYVLIPPHVYTFSLSHGFNFSERSLYLPDNWMQNIFQLYEEQLLDGCTFKEALPFSFEEMLIRMANQQHMLTSTNAETVYNILSKIIDNHLKYCDKAKNAGLPLKIIHKSIELVDENVRRCFVCGSVAFLAVLKCNVCKKVTCLKHFPTKNDHETCQQQQQQQQLHKEHHQHQRHQEELHQHLEQDDDIHCIQPFITFYLKYTPSQLASILATLKKRVERHKKWLQTVDHLLPSSTNKKKFSSYAELIAFKNKYYKLNMKSDILIMGVENLINSVKKLVDDANGILLGDCPKLSLNSLKTLYNDLINCPCLLEVTDKIRKHIETVEDFNEAMNQLLSSSSTPLTELPATKTLETESTTSLKRKFSFSRSDLNYLMDVSKSLLVEHSYSDVLNKIYEQVAWIEESENVIKNLSLTEPTSSSSSSTLSAFLTLTSSRHWIDNNDLKQVKNLIKGGLKFLRIDRGSPLRKKIEEVISVLRCANKQSELLNDIISSCITSQRPLVLKEMKELLKLAEDHPSNVKSDKLIKLKNKISMAEQWEQEFEQLLSNDNSPYLHDMQRHLEKSAELPVSLEILTQLQSDICKAVDWLKKAEDLFVVQRGDADQAAFGDDSFFGGCKSGSSLFEILIPGSNMYDASSLMVLMKTVKRKGSNQFPYNLHQMNDPNVMTKCIREAEAKELEDMLILRTVNKLKWISNDSLYCFCKKPLSLDMQQCFLCYNYFHASCQENNQIASTVSSNYVTTTNKREAVETSAQPTSVSSNSSSAGTISQLRYYCINCCHSKRPALDSVYQLLVTLLLVPLRIIEGQLLEMLVDRVGLWMNRLKEYLQSDECRPTISHLLFFEETIYQLEKCELVVKDADIQRLKNFIESSNTVFERLDRYVVEGELLEVSTDEHDYVWRFMSLYYRSMKLIDNFVKSAEQAKEKRLKSIYHSVEDENFDTKRPTQTDRQITTSAAKAPDIKPTDQHKREANTKTSSNSPTKKCKFTLEDYKTNICNDDLELGSNDGDDKDNDEMVEEEEDEEEEEEDEDIMSESNESDDCNHEDCSVGNCLRPLGKQVNWIQCDKCSKWYHHVCLGLRVNQFRENDEFICQYCYL